MKICWQSASIFPHEMEPVVADAVNAKPWLAAEEPAACVRSVDVALCNAITGSFPLFVVFLPVSCRWACQQLQNATARLNRDARTRKEEKTCPKNICRYNTTLCSFFLSLSLFPRKCEFVTVDQILSRHRRRQGEAIRVRQ